jgi:GNAT superfamily N-acetyltransferase
MTVPLARYVLRPVRSAADWAAYHTIRRTAIFAALLPAQAYDECHPDEFKNGCLPHVLLCDGEIVGAVRIDLIDAAQVGLRLVGIRTDQQRRGHGAALLELAEQIGRERGRSEIVINAHPTSLAFYLRNGYAECDWRDAGPVPAGLIRVGKRLVATE